MAESPTASPEVLHVFIIQYGRQPLAQEEGVGSVCRDIHVHLRTWKEEEKLKTVEEDQTEA